MEKFLSFLKTHTEPWLSFGSTFLDAEPSSSFLIGGGLLLLYLWYLMLKPIFPSLCKTKDFREPQHRATKGRKSTLTGQRTRQREAEAVRKLLSVVQSHPDQPYDPARFRQLLCPDARCGICTTEAAKVSRLLSLASPEDDTSSLSSWATTALETEPSFPLSCTSTTSTHGHLIPAPASESSPPHPSIVLPRELVSTEDIIAAPPLGDSVPPETVSPSKSKFPVGHIPLHQPPSFPTLPQSSTDSVVQLDAAHSLVCRLGEVSTDVPTTKHIDSAICARSESSQQQTAAHTLPPLDSVQSTAQETRSSESSSDDESTASPVEPGNHSSTNPDEASLLERQDQISESLQKAPSTSWVTSESGADPQDLADSRSQGSSEGQPEETPWHQQSRDPKASQGQEENKHKDLCLGHPSLHSESRVSVASASGDSSEKSTCLIRMSYSPVLSYPIPLPSADSQLQVCLPRSQDEAKLLRPSQIHLLEYSILKDKQKRVWGLPSVVQNSPKEFCPPSPKLSMGKESSGTHTFRSIPPVDFPLTTELGKKLDFHLQKRLIQQCLDLPTRLLESWSYVDIRMRPPVSSESRTSSTESSRRAGSVLKGTLGPKDPKTPNGKNHLSRGLKFKSEDRQNSLALRLCNKMSLALEECSYKVLITHDQSRTSGDMTDSPVLHVFLRPGGSSMGQGKEGPRLPARALGSGVTQSSPPAPKRKFPPSSTKRELGGGASGLGTSHPTGKVQGPEHRPRGGRASTSLSQRGQPPPESHVGRHIKHFLQRVSPGRTWKAAQRSLEKSTPASSSLQGTGHLKGHAVLPAHDLGERVPNSSEKVLKKEGGLMRAAVNNTRPHVSSLGVKSGKCHPKEERQIRAEPVPSHRMHLQRSCSKGTLRTSCSQATVIAGQQTRIGHKNGQSPKGVTFQKKPLCQGNPPSVPNRELGCQQKSS